VCDCSLGGMAEGFEVWREAFYVPGKQHYHTDLSETGAKQLSFMEETNEEKRSC